MLISKILDLAITYNENDIKRINHLIKVYSFASLIGELENCEPQLQTISCQRAIKRFQF
jgi:hypothetical protein